MWDLTFRPGTTDFGIADCIFHHAEYPLPARFRAEDTVIDVGAHIGAFSLACLQRGAGRVLAWEPDAANVALCRQHLAPYIVRNPAFASPYGCRCGVMGHAVWRSDGPLPEDVYLSGAVYEGNLLNTGSRDVFAAEGEPVTPIALDTILRITGPVRLLKLDCEGSEFPILATSARLGQVQEIVGEVHEYGGPHDTRTPPFALPGLDAWTGAALGDLLAQRGFTVWLERQHTAGGRQTHLLRLHALRRD